MSQPTQGMQAERYTPTPEDIEAIRAELNAVIELIHMANRGLQMHEAVNGIRLLEPHNSLCIAIRDLYWCGARLSGLGPVQAPRLAGPTRALIVRHPAESGRGDHLARSNHP